MNTNETIVDRESLVKTHLDESEQQEKDLKDLQAKIKATKSAKRDKELPNLLQSIAQVMAKQKQLGVSFIPLVRKDYIIREAVRWLKKATVQEIEAKIGKHLQPLLDSKETSLKAIEAHVKEKSRTEETGPDGKIQKLTPWYKWDGDGYIVIERKEG